jgi:deoxyribodipyrimidine photolyase-related protein
MTDDHWSIFHSRLSFAMNLKLISPKEVVEMAEDYWKQHQDLISISQAEGFIRQILGWREFMRGVYWANMPKFEKLNYFENSRKLPSFFWTGNTKMNCLSRAIKQSLKFGYAHHIQRLMVTGNFALLSGIHPNAVDEWYLGIYVDAFQWVEITNTRGMSQYADGGIVGTKPYISSASYINKMSDHCSSCIYDHKKRTGKDACPFNSLYWRFLEVNQDKLKDNQRMSMMYSVWQKMDKSTKDEIVDQASYYLDYIEEL